jgi:hypothetical protein
MSTFETKQPKTSASPHAPSPKAGCGDWTKPLSTYNIGPIPKTGGSGHLDKSQFPSLQKSTHDHSLHPPSHVLEKQKDAKQLSVLVSGKKGVVDKDAPDPPKVEVPKLVLEEKKADPTPSPVKKKADLQPAPEKKAELQPTPVEKKAELQPTLVEKKAELQPTPVEKKAELQPTPVEKKAELQPTSEKKVLAPEKKADLQPTPEKKSELQPVPVNKRLTEHMISAYNMQLSRHSAGYPKILSREITAKLECCLQYGPKQFDEKIRAETITLFKYLVAYNLISSSCAEKVAKFHAEPLDKTVTVERVTMKEDLFRDAICTICLDLIVDPASPVPVSEDEKCDHTFCKKCLSAAFEKKKACPLCRVEAKDKLFANIYVAKYIKQIPIKCWNDECKAILTIADNDTHKCEWNKAICPMCAVICPEKDLSLHSATVCQKRQVECKECKESSPFDIMHFHDHLCKRKIIPCPNRIAETKDRNCGMSFPMEELAKHNESCSYFLITCTIGCGKQLTYKSMSKYHKTQCPERNVKCAVCQEVLKSKDLKTHEETSCIKVCGNGCGAKFLFAKELDHLASCPKAAVDCVYSSIGCEHKMLRENCVQHRRNYEDYHVKLALGQKTKADPDRLRFSLAKERLVRGMWCDVHVRADLWDVGVIIDVDDEKKQVKVSFPRHWSKSDVQKHYLNQWIDISANRFAELGAYGQHYCHAEESELY